ncbi:hypothetical protein EUTSA_v10023337mg [Eutrema salsugineum]|uniref:Uncharacterized protein n=1 Tax=Eutrema salsugineum TaxID=72664 RepID=V4KGS8_EUTSA|nr:nuclear pore complex protein NUP98A [Eutrema salsugineum]ESQ29022.1 hypothetical protein EUTSA_v10023337mg [Eutrema salsugineum]
MRIDCSKPEECGCVFVTCYHCRTSGILNTQESEPSNVIASSVATTMPASSRPVQALGHDSAAIGSTTSTSSPVRCSSPIRSGTLTPLAPPDITPVSSEPAQSLAPNNLGSGSSAAPTSSTFVRPIQAHGFGSCASAAPTSSTASPGQISSPTSFAFAPSATSFSSAPAQASGPTIFGGLMQPRFGFGASAAPKPSTTSSTSSPVQNFSPTMFQFHPAVTSVSSAFAGPTSPINGSMQTPVQASAANTSTSFSYGDFGKTASSSLSQFRNSVDLARPVVGFSSAVNTSTTTSVFGAPRVSVSSMFGPTQDFAKTSFASPSVIRNGFDFARADVGFPPAINTSTTTTVFGSPPPASVSSLFGPTQDFAKTSSVWPSNTSPKNPFSSSFPGFGVDYFPGSPFNHFGSNPPTTEQGSRFPRYAPTPVDCDFRGHRNMITSIAASSSYQHKSHEELRWEDYKHGDKGGIGFFPPAHVSPGSRPNAFFSPSPSIFAPRIIPDHRHRTTTVTTEGNMKNSGFGFPAAGGTTSSSSSSTFPVSAPIKSVERPHETVAVSSPASGCTACGPKSSSSASGYSGFNVATTPPSAAISLPGLFFSTAGFYPMMFGTTNLEAQGTTTNPALQAYPMMFGTNLAAQAYPVHGLILLPFAAMNLQ